MRSTIGRKVTTSLNRPRSRPFSSCIGKRLAEGNPVIGRASSLLSSPDRCILPALLEIDSATFSPDLSTPRKIFSAIARRPVRSRSTNRNERILEGEKDGRRFGAGPRRSATNRATESRAAPLFLEERRAGRGGKIPIQLDKTFSLSRAALLERAGLSVGLSRRPQREHKEQVGTRWRRFCTGLCNKRQVFHRFKSAYRRHITRLFPDSIHRTRRVRNLLAPPPAPGRGIYLPTGLYEFTACRKGVINSARYWSRRCAIRFAEATRRGKPIGSPRRLYFRYCHRRLAESITYNIFYTQVVI